MTFNKDIIDEHKQISQFSCIPSAVEMILKLLNKIKINNYELQTSWNNKRDGSFSDFDNKKLHGLLFKRHFALPRDDNFPIKDLFTKIDDELENNRYVIVSIANLTGWHMYIIYEKINDEYLSFSKNQNNTIYKPDVKNIIIQMEGTDILTYEIL